MIYCIAGKNAIAINGLHMLINRGIPTNNIRACVNRSDTGINNWQRSFKKECVDLNIKIVTLETLYEIEDLIFISLEYDQIIKVNRFKSENLYNIHFSLLPEFKGMYTSAWPILSGKNYSGVTLHKIDQGIDTGDIIDQIRFEFDYDTTAFGLYNLYLENSTQLLSQNLTKLIQIEYTAVLQASSGASYFSKSSINYAGLKIDFNKTAFEVKNQIRAFSFRPFQLPEVGGYAISHADISNNKSINKPGTIVDNDLSLILSTIDFDIVLYKDMLDNILDAAKTDNLELYIQLTAFNYKFDYKNDKGWNALIVSCFYESKAVFDYLIQLGYDINATNYNGTTCFMYAMTAAFKSGNTYFMQRLIDMGADIFVKDFKGEDAFYYAHKDGSLVVGDFLKSYKND